MFKVKGTSFHAEEVASSEVGQKILIKESDSGAIGFYTLENSLLGYASKEDKSKINKLIVSRYNAHIEKKIVWQDDLGKDMPTGLRVKVVAK